MVICAGSYAQNTLSGDKSYQQSLTQIAATKSNFDRSLFAIDTQINQTKNPIISYNTAVTQFEIGNLPEAEYFFNLAIKYDPYFAEAYLFLGRIRIQQRVYNDAVLYANKAVQYDPELVAAHLDLFLGYSRLQNKEEANKHLLAAAKLDPENVSKTASRLIIEKDDLYGALFFFEKVHQVAPTNILNSLNYAKALMIADKDMKAEKVLEIAYQANDFYHEHFQLLYSMYFAKLMQHGKHETILLLASEKVPSSFASQYLYKSLCNFKLNNIAEFERNAELYFQFKNDPIPKSLTAWAQSQLVAKAAGKG